MKFTYAAGDRPLEGYTIKRAIHRGGFGEVYYAHTDAGKEVALKLLHENGAVELRGVSQCLNLKHPRLVTLFDIRTDAEQDHWVIMEYVAGETLADRLRRAPSGIRVAEALETFRQISDGLEFLHARNLVHRDLKPANIFLEAGQAKIGDVGLSKFIGPSTRSMQTQSVGTVHYMAPEIARGDYGLSVDLYALGIILYEMLTGRVPFAGESTAEILMKHLTQHPDLSTLPVAFRDVVGRALAKTPAERFRSVAEMRAAVQRAAGLSVAESEMAGANSQTTAADAVAAKRRTIPVTDSAASSPEPVNFGHKSHRSCQPQRRSARDCFGPPRLFPRAAKSTGPCCWTPASCWSLPARGSWWWLVIMVGILIFTVHTRGLTRLPAGMSFVVIPALLGAAYFSLVRFNQVPAGPVNPGGVAASRPPAAPIVPLQNRTAPAPRAVRTRREKFGSLLQGMAVAPVVLSLIAGTIAFFSRDFFSSSWLPAGTDLGHLLFFVTSSTLACWGILLSGYCWSERRRDLSGIRALLLGIGLLIGFAVSGLGDWFLVHFPPHLFASPTQGIVSRLGRHELAMQKPIGLPARSFDGEQLPGPREMFVSDRGERFVVSEQPTHKPVRMAAASGRPPSRPLPADSWSPTHIGYGLFFGMLLAFRAWPRFVNYHREHRFLWGSVALSAALGYLICLIIPFPTVWGMTWAAAITAGVQLSAPCALRPETHR